MASCYTFCVNPIMPMFDELIETFDPEADGSYQTAIENVFFDMHGQNNQFGNITSIAQKSLDTRCTSPNGENCIDIELLIQEHHSYQQASGAVPRKKPDEDLRRVVTFNDFVTYHHNGDNESRSNLLRIGSIKSGPISVDRLLGTTGCDEKPSWWTFGRPCPGDGQRYVDELALTIKQGNPFDDLADVNVVKGIIEIRIPSADFPKNLFKPSALDGFGQHTKFEPDLTDSEHGWTKPDTAKVGLERRPEFVSQSFSYSEVDQDLDLEVTYLPLLTIGWLKWRAHLPTRLRPAPIGLMSKAFVGWRVKGELIG